MKITLRPLPSNPLFPRKPIFPPSGPATGSFNSLHRESNIITFNLMSNFCRFSVIPAVAALVFSISNSFAATWDVVTQYQ